MLCCAGAPIRVALAITLAMAGGLYKTGPNRFLKAVVHKVGLVNEPEYVLRP